MYPTLWGLFVASIFRPCCRVRLLLIRHEAQIRQDDLLQALAERDDLNAILGRDYADDLAARIAFVGFG